MALNKPAAPWFRQAWPWFLVSLPLTAVIAGFITLWLAVVSDDGLVADDYYKQGLALQQSIVRDHEAARLGLVAKLRFGGGQVMLNLSSTDTVMPPTVFLRLVHPTRHDMDRAISLVGDNGNYTASTDALDGRWQVLLEDESRAWRLTGTIELPAETEVRLEALQPVN
ncbi:FixH family protein [Zoogloeaceae bacterium G21618-S1]|nr:FixH family protein [Zoogloeaceae bacterium G21618-S1]